MMKKTQPILLKLLILGVILVAMTSCQDEIEPKIETDMDRIVFDDPVAKSIVTVVTKDGSADNIVDESSCTTVKFPIMGWLEDEVMEFNSLDEVVSLGVGALEVDWVFPMEVILSDHTQVTLNSEDELEIIQDNCIEWGDDPDNECIDFVYPFTIRVFDTNTENVDTREITSDKDAYRTFTSNNLVITIEYPINMVNVTNDQMQVFSNEELTGVITNAQNSCDEQDIVEFEEVFEEEIRALFIAATWSISLYEEDENNSTALFSGYTIRFNEDLTLQSQGGEVVNGEWEIGLEDTGASISIAFDTDNEPLSLLNESWIILDYDQNQIDLEYPDTGESTKRLQLASAQ